MATVGSNGYRYELVPVWPNMPRYWSFGMASNGAVNSKDEVHVFSRGEHPVTVWSTDGDFITSWGEGAFEMPHGIYIAPNDNVWLIDAQDHIATLHKPDGEIIKTLGVKGVSKASFHGKPFNMPTGLAIAPNGELFMSDGYGGHRVHRFSADGELMLSWGKEGTGSGEFVNLHNIAVDGQSRVYICDRENNRVQRFGADGAFLDEWTDLQMPNDIVIMGDVACICEGGPGGRRVGIWSLDGGLVTSWTEGEGPLEGATIGGHGIWLDSQGSIYLGGDRVTKFQRI